MVDGGKHFEGRFSIVGADSADGNVQPQRSSSCGPLAAWSEKRDEGIPTLDPPVRNASMCVRKVWLGSLCLLIFRSSCVILLQHIAVCESCG